MNTDFKALKKLADTCRKAGIKSYKCPEFEFTLSDEGPLSTYKKKALKSNPEAFSDTSIKASDDNLTEEQLLFYSVARLTEEGEQQSKQ